jgi:Flp pilus assembly protein TadD
MQFSFDSSTSDFNLQERDDSVVTYDWSEVLEYTRSKSADESLLKDRFQPNLGSEHHRLAYSCSHPQERAATLEEIALEITVNADRPDVDDRHELITPEVNDDRQETEFYRARGRERQQLGNFSAALSGCDLVIRSQPDRASVYNDRAEIYRL